MMKHLRKKQLSRYIATALTVGMFGLVPVAYALPVQDTTHSNTTGTGINTVASQMNITGTAANNVMNWQTFSIAKGEKVQFDEKNYLNLVRGASKSEIDGALSGKGNIYLINPNGILFGSNAQVNVGNLVASTRAIDSVDASGFAATGANPLATAATSASGDIVNMGKLQTASVVLEGNNITIQNAADITSDGTKALASAVTVKAAGIITVGHAVTATTTRSFTINGTATDETVHDYKNAAVAASGYKTAALDGTTENTVKECMLVENVYDLQNMDAKLDGNYMLAGDIDASDSKKWDSGAGFSPVGNLDNVFTGTFDGVNHTISSLYIYRPVTDNVGLFGVSSGGNIQNVGMVGGSVTGHGDVGSVAGYNTDYCTITNVYNTGTVNGVSTPSIESKNVGGVVGFNYGTLTNSYNTGTISGINGVGGVAGATAWRVKNVYNTGAVSGSAFVGGVLGSDALDLINAYNTGTVSGIKNVGGVVGEIGGAAQGKLINAYNTGTVSGTSNVGGVVGINGHSITNVYNTGEVSGSDNVGGVTGYNNYETGDPTATNALWANDLTYTPATGSKPTQAVGNEADTDTVKGATLADMKKAATYSSWQGDTGSIVATTGNAGKTWRIYEDYTTPLLTSFFKGVVTVTGISDQTVTYNGIAQAADISGAVYSPSDLNTGHIYAGGGRNAGTYGLMYSDQQGYDLVMDKSLTITPKNLTATLVGDNVFTKVYDGTTAVSQTLTLGTTYYLDGMAADDHVSIAANSTGAYNDKNAGDNKTISYSGITLTGTDAGNYTIANTLSGAVGQITRKTITGSLASGYSFDKQYDGTTTASLGNGYTLNGVVAGDTVPLSAANGFYDSSAMGDRTVTFSGFSINDGNYLLSMADSLSGTGKIISGLQDQIFIDSLAGFGSFFDTDPAGGMTIFRSNPEDYIPRAVTKNNGQSYQVGVAQVTQTWYNGPLTLTIVNGGINLPKGILLGDTYDTRTVVIKGNESYQN